MGIAAVWLIGVNLLKQESDAVCSLSWSTGLPVSRSTGFPVYRSTGFPVYRSTGLPVSQLTALNGKDR